MAREYSTQYGTAELSPQEQRQLTEALAKLPASDQEAIKAGVQCLPKQQQCRAMLEWCERWESRIFKPIENLTGRSRDRPYLMTKVFLICLALLPLAVACDRLSGSETQDCVRETQAQGFVQRCKALF